MAAKETFDDKEELKKFRLDREIDQQGAKAGQRVRLAKDESCALQMLGEMYRVERVLTCLVLGELVGV